MSAQPVRIALVVSEFNYDITKMMEEKALSHAKFLGAEVPVVFHVPGFFDSPFGVAQVIKLDYVDAVAVIGAVIQGQTKHDELIANQATRALVDLSLQYNKPVTLGVIGPGASRAQALERIEEYSRRAIEAAVKLVRRQREMSALSYTPGQTLVVE
ncbi:MULTISPECIES: 6,7-dimethyl-8-ribityllumazine synthase [Acidilobus]|uniref:6,7-dimethyl-8-ribityllumazine synthase n=1 Tax=Acidilobus saccharovorans (strain DSM 16705 / JCM 18335 / VKM B-2471 / 345-15) TaxID=666510 RepID=D9Q1N0_ACIS3|nr:6,7-dimethyl-8-ribityllumazine synthase [Acidilobus saccharovorans]ADL19218.1 6,7-dimethyl-8-ribityllumazine synthase [Acidilobus saccharovorans 345-15]